MGRLVTSRSSRADDRAALFLHANIGPFLELYKDAARDHQLPRRREFLESLIRAATPSGKGRELRFPCNARIIRMSRT